MSARPRFNPNRSDGEPFGGKRPRPVAELEACFVEWERLMTVVRERLSEVGAKE